VGAVIVRNMERFRPAGNTHVRGYLRGGTIMTARQDAITALGEWYAKKFDDLMWYELTLHPLLKFFESKTELRLKREGR
jgi:hypothetical protein